MSMTHPEVSARVAVLEDLSELRRLANEARDAVESARGGRLWALRDAMRQPAPFDDLIAQPNSFVAVGTLDDQVLGYLAASLDELHDGHIVATIIELFVHPGARELGLGEALTDLVIEWATASGCIGIDSIALPGDRDTKNFFEDAGLVARAIVVHRQLLPSTDE